MGNIKELINDLNSKGILIWENEGKIAYKSPVGVMNEKIKNIIRTHEDELIKYLREESRIKRIKIIGNDALVEIEPSFNEESNYIDIKENAIDEVKIFEREATKLINDNNLSKWVNSANDVALRDIFKTFYCEGVFKENKYYSLKEIINILEIDVSYECFIEKWLRVLVENNIVMQGNEGYKILDYSYVDKIAEDYWKNFENIEEKINYGHDFFNYMNKCSDFLLDILQKKVNTVDILFPEGSDNSAVGVYSNNKGSRLFNKLVANIVYSYIQASEKEQAVKILEIGAGIGGTTRFIVDKIKNENFEYFYTDISFYFLNKAKEKYGTQNMKYKIFDINDSVYRQGFSNEKFDIILCANMLHNSKNGFEALKNINYLIKDKGIFIIIDETTEPEFLLTSIELNDALSNFYDDRAKDNGVFFTYKQWMKMFEVCKANIWIDFPQKNSDLSFTGQRLFVGNFNDSYSINEKIVRDSIDDCLKKVVVVDDIDKETSIKVGTEEKNEEVDKKILVEMIEIWEEILQSEDIKSTDNFFEVGGDSLVITQLITKLWNKYPKTKMLKWKEFTDIIFRYPVLKDLALFLEDFNNNNIKNEINENYNITELVSCDDPNKVYIFFHDGTGELNIYNNFVNVLNEKKKNVAIYGFRIENIKEFNIESLYEDLAIKYSSIIISQFKEQEIVLVGHCVGGLLALETGRILLDKDINLSEVVLISSYLNEGSILYGNNILKKYLESNFLMGIVFGEVIGNKQSTNPISLSEIENVMEYIENNRINSFERGVKETKYTNKELYTKLKDYEEGKLIPTQYVNTFDIFKKFFLAASEYRPSSYKGVLKFVHGNFNTNNFFMEGASLFSDNENLWKKVVDRNIIYYSVNGDHFSVINKENSIKIIEDLL